MSKPDPEAAADQAIETAAIAAGATTELNPGSDGKKFKRVSKAGRPPKLNADLIDEIARYVRVGNYIETAAIAAGVHKATFYNWMKQANKLRELLARAQETGEKPKLTKFDRLTLKFLDAVEKATAEADFGDVATIKTASKTNWQAAAWRLERKDPKRWGRQDKVIGELSGPGGSPIPTTTENISGMSQEEKDELLIRHYERIKRQRAAQAGEPAAADPERPE